MNRALIPSAILFAFLLEPVVARAAPVSAPEPAAVSVARVRLAKAPSRKKKGAPEKPAAEKAAPEGARSDPRASAPAADAPPVDLGGRRGMGRIEFDARLIQGQTNKANAIYIFERRESALRSLLKKRTSFHEEIDETLE